jgi:HPt (histidine-containing phosphotransfer) domain-containing protein
MADKNFRLITEIETELRDLIPNFLKNRMVDLGKAREFAQNQDFGPLVNLAHALKGACMSYGFHAAAKIAAAIESAATDCNLNLVLKMLERLQTSFEHLEICYV